MAAKQNVYISLVGKDNVSKTLKNVNRGLASLKGGAMAVGRTFMKLGAVALTAATAIAAGLAKATKAAAEEEKGIVRLNAAIAANIKGSTDLVAVEEKIAAQQERLAYSDGELRDSLTKLLPYVKSTDKAFAAQSVAADLARMKGIDLATASEQIGRALGGNTRVLKSLGIELPKTAKKSEILAAIQGKVAGQAEAYANSTEGQFTSLKNTFDDLVEDLGREFLPIALEVARWAKSTLLPAIQRAIPQVAAFGRQFIEVSKQVITVAAGIARELQPRLIAMANFIGSEVIPRVREFFGFLSDNRGTIAFVAGAVLGLIAALKVYTTTMAAIRVATQAYAAVQAAFNAVMLANPIGLVVLAITALIAGFAAAYAASEDFRKVVDGVFAALKPLVPIVGQALVAAFNAITAPIRILIGLLQTVFDLIGKVVNAIADSPVGALLGGIAGFVGDLFGGKRANGGPVRSGKAYLVGEKGPEIFAPGAAGMIIPNRLAMAPAMASTGNGGGGLSARDLRRAMEGMTIVLDGERVGRAVDTRLARSIRTSQTSSRLR